MMNWIRLLTATAESAAEQAQLVFEPANFISHLKNMGIGMLVIFVVIGIIILVTMMINKLFSE